MDEIDAFIDAGTALLAIPLDPAWRDAVRANMEVILRQAAVLQAQDIPDETEMAPVFRA